MKKNIIVILLACVAVCMAETVSYSIPVLTVRSDDKGALAGSGKANLCPFMFVDTANSTPVKVSITEDLPLGAGGSLRASVWLAVTTAAMTLNRDLSGAMISFETSGYVDGPSAGGMLCLAVMSALEGRKFPDDFAMTGTIMVDGTIGAVGGVAEKIRAASRAGMKRVCIPAATRLDDKDFTDLLDLGKSLGLEMHQVSTIGEAYQILHRLSPPLVERLNPFDVCQLPSHVESVLKHRYSVLFDELVQGDVNVDPTRSLGEFTSGFFGAAVIDLVDCLNEQTQSRASLHLESAVIGKYSLLEREFPTDGLAVSGLFSGRNPSKAEYVDALRAFHQDLKELEQSDDDDVGEDEDGFETDDDDDTSEENLSEDWFDDYVWSPGESQLNALANNDVAESEIYRMQCDDITKQIDSIRDWSALDANDLNAVRSMLMDKLNSLVCMRLLESGAENYERQNLIYTSLLGTMPYIRANSSVQQVENLFYRTMTAMSLAITESGIRPDSFLARYCRSLIGTSELLHVKSPHDEEPLIDAVFSEAQTLSVTCALLMCTDSAVSNNPAFFSSIVTIARDNALSNIAECRKLGIPCVMPVIYFQRAESRRDASSAGEDMDLARFSVLRDYLCGSLLSKALILCFEGQKPELNSKGYCCRSTVWNDESSIQTMNYLGVDGKPILRDGFSGYGKGRNDKIGDYTFWYDINGNIARYQDTNQCCVMSYDDAGHLVKKISTDASWKLTPREDGVLFETFGYDKAGNQTKWEFWGASSNRVVCKDGMAVIKSRFNERGQETLRRYFGVFGEPVTHVDGYAGYDVTYGKLGNQHEIITYVGQDGKPVMTKWGYAKVLVMHSPSGEAIECRFYGPDGLPTLHREGMASWKAEVDASGQVIGRKFYNLQRREIDINTDKGEDLP